MMENFIRINRDNILREIGVDEKTIDEIRDMFPPGETYDNDRKDDGDLL